MSLQPRDTEAATRLHVLGGAALVAAGLILALATMLAAGEGHSWDAADAFASDSMRPIRKIGMLLSVAGLALLVAATPIVVARLHRTRGFVWAVSGWVAFACGATLFTMIIGLTAIAMPALGTLAAAGAVSPQQVADHFVQQPATMVSFVSANVMFLSWVLIGIGLARSALFPRWLGIFMAIAAIIDWLSFLHVPGIERYGGLLWPLAITLMGAYFVRRRNVGV